MESVRPFAFVEPPCLRYTTYGKSVPDLASWEADQSCVSQFALSLSP